MLADLLLPPFNGRTEFTTGRAAEDLAYVAWSAKASTEYAVSGAGRGATRDSRYLARVDGHTVGRTAWDLDITSPHPLTASAPRDATAGSGDPDGCADGSESRADHASSR